MIGVPGTWPAICNQAHEPVWQVELLPRVGNPVLLPAVSVELRRASGGWPATTAAVSWPAAETPAPAPAGYLPYGSRVRISWAPSPDEPLTVLATLWSSRVTLTRPGGTWTVDCVDSSGMIDEDNIIGTTGPYGWAPAVNETLQAACTRLIRRTFPAAAVTATTTAAAALTAVVPATFDATSRRSPWELVESLTGLAGCTCRILPDDSYRFELVPDIGSAVDAVDVLKNITGYEVQWNSAWNTVVHEYKDTAPMLGVWQDTRPGSPLAVGVLGRRITLWESRDGTPTQVQADEGAKVQGRRAAGLARALSVDVVGRPWLEAGDTVDVSFLGGPVQEKFLITFAEHSSRGSSRIGLRNYKYTTTDPI